MSYISPHNLEFSLSEGLPNFGGHSQFTYGTIHGLMRVDDVRGIGKCVVVNSIVNEAKGNGHFADLMGYLKAFCLANHVHLVFEHVGEIQRAGLEDGDPKRFATHLRRRGFRNIGGTTHWWMSLYRMME